MSLLNRASRGLRICTVVCAWFPQHHAGTVQADSVAAVEGLWKNDNEVSGRVIGNSTESAKFSPPLASLVNSDADLNIFSATSHAMLQLRKGDYGKNEDIDDISQWRMLAV